MGVPELSETLKEDQIKLNSNSNAFHFYAFLCHCSKAADRPNIEWKQPLQVGRAAAWFSMKNQRSAELTSFFSGQALGQGPGGWLGELGIVMERKLLRKACVKMLGLPSASLEMKLFSEMCFIKQSSTQYRAHRVWRHCDWVMGNGFLGGKLVAHLSLVCPGLALPLLPDPGWSLSSAMRWENSEDLVLSRSSWRYLDITSRGQPSSLVSWFLWSSSGAGSRRFSDFCLLGGPGN